MTDPDLISVPAVPAEYAHREGLYWPRMAVILHKMAVTGCSVRAEMAIDLSARFRCHIGSPALKFPFYYLAADGLIVAMLAPLIGASKITLTRLTEKGVTLCREWWNFEPLESDWTRLERLRSPDPAYIALTLQAAFHARIRGWTVTIAPEGQDTRPPDLRFENSEGVYSVYIMPARLRPTKSMVVGLCAAAEEVNHKLAFVTVAPRNRAVINQQCASADLFGRWQIADIETLIHAARKNDTGNFWFDPQEQNLE